MLNGTGIKYLKKDINKGSGKFNSLPALYIKFPIIWCTLLFEEMNCLIQRKIYFFKYFFFLSVNSVFSNWSSSYPLQPNLKSFSKVCKHIIVRGSHILWNFGVNVSGQAKEF